MKIFDHLAKMEKGENWFKSVLWHQSKSNTDLNQLLNWCKYFLIGKCVKLINAVYQLNPERKQLIVIWGISQIS